MRDTGEYHQHIVVKIKLKHSSLETNAVQKLTNFVEKQLSLRLKQEVSRVIVVLERL